MHKQIFFFYKKRSDLLFSSFAYHPLKAWNTGVPLSRREFRAKWRQIILPELPQILEILSFIWVCRKNPPNFTWIVFLPCIFLQTAEDGFPLRPWFFSWSRNANLRMRHFVARSNVAKKGDDVFTILDIKDSSGDSIKIHVLSEWNIFIKPSLVYSCKLRKLACK